jgi:hypothetical protein
MQNMKTKNVNGWIFKISPNVLQLYLVADLEAQTFKLVIT